MYDALLREIQRRLEQLAAAFSRADARLTAVEQSQQKAWGLMPPGGVGSDSTSVLFAVTPSSGSWPGAAPPTGTPGSFTADVYKIAGGDYVAVATSATIQNGYPSSPGNNKVITVAPNGDGSYSVLGESCS